jgi:hypothetical protein
MLSEGVDASCALGGTLMLAACLVSGSDGLVDPPSDQAARTLRAGRQRPRALSLCMARARREAPWAARLLRFGPRPA